MPKKRIKRQPKFKHNERDIRRWLDPQLGKFQGDWAVFRDQHLAMGKHWVKDWKEIYYTEEAVDILRKVLGVIQVDKLPDESPPLDVVPEPIAIPVLPPAPKPPLPAFTGVITKCGFRNNRLVQASYEGKEVFVWVKNAEQYRRGMKLLLVPAGKEGYYRSNTKPRRV